MEKSIKVDRLVGNFIQQLQEDGVDTSSIDSRAIQKELDLLDNQEDGYVGGDAFSTNSKNSLYSKLWEIRARFVNPFGSYNEIQKMADLTTRAQQDTPYVIDHPTVKEIAKQPVPGRETPTEQVIIAKARKAQFNVQQNSVMNSVMAGTEVAKADMGALYALDNRLLTLSREPDLQQLKTQISDFRELLKMIINEYGTYSKQGGEISAKLKELVTVVTNLNSRLSPSYATQAQAEFPGVKIRPSLQMEGQFLEKF